MLVTHWSVRIPSCVAKELHQHIQVLAGHQHHQSVDLCKGSPVCGLWLVPACDCKAPAQLRIRQREACITFDASIRIVLHLEGISIFSTPHVVMCHVLTSVRYWKAPLDHMSAFDCSEDSCRKACLQKGELQVPRNPQAPAQQHTLLRPAHAARCCTGRTLRGTLPSTAPPACPALCM